jgi:uncharacterized protein YjbI with pentapeptide repeats
MSPWARVRLRRFGAHATVLERDASSAPKLPEPAPLEFAKKSAYIDALKKTVDDAAALGGGLWFSYLFVIFYLAVAAGAVTQADLFFQKPVKLPFLNIELPLLAFFALAPYLFLVAHAYVLLHLAMLTEKTERYRHELAQFLLEQIPDEAARSQTTEGMRGQLPSNVFVELLAGPRRLNRGAFGLALRAVAWSTLVVGPVLLLLLFQFQFLPYHSDGVTWAHRAALLLDLGLIWWLSRLMFSWDSDAPNGVVATVAWRLGWALFSALAAVAIAIFSTTIVTFRSEADTDWLTNHDPSGLVKGVHEAIFGETAEEAEFPFSDTLALSNVDAYVELGIDDPKKAEWKEFIFNAAGRRLEGATFRRSQMSRVNFEGAELQGADLEFAQLEGSSFAEANLQGVDLFVANLRVAKLSYAQLQRALLNGAQLQGARLRSADLEGASLSGAQLQGALLDDALLGGASLEGAQLQGASLVDARLKGASLRSAQLQGATLYVNRPRVLVIGNSQLQELSRDGSLAFSLPGRPPDVEATDFDEAFLWRTTLTPSMSAGHSISEEAVNWGPFFASEPYSEVVPWNQAAFESLRKQLEALPPGDLRNEALARIESLDCKEIASPPCDSSGASVTSHDNSDKSEEWRDAFLRAAADRQTYQKALVKALRPLICDHAVRPAYFARDVLPASFENVGKDGEALVEELLDKGSNTCRVARKLNDGDRYRLNNALQRFKASTSSAN